MDYKELQSQKHENYFLLLEGKCSVLVMKSKLERKGAKNQKFKRAHVPKIDKDQKDLGSPKDQIEAKFDGYE